VNALSAGEQKEKRNIFLVVSDYELQSGFDQRRYIPSVLKTATRNNSRIAVSLGASAGSSRFLFDRVKR
jgi:hypothetical protein